MLIMLWVKASKSRRMTEKTGDQTINQNCISAYEYQFLIRICISPHSCFFLKFYRLFFGFWWVSASSYLVVVFFRPFCCRSLFCTNHFFAWAVEIKIIRDASLTLIALKIVIIVIYGWGAYLHWDHLLRYATE